MDDHDEWISEALQQVAENYGYSKLPSSDDAGAKLTVFTMYRTDTNTSKFSF